MCGKRIESENLAVNKERHHPRVIKTDKKLKPFMQNNTNTKKKKEVKILTSVENQPKLRKPTKAKKRKKTNKENKPKRRK